MRARTRVGAVTIALFALIGTLGVTTPASAAGDYPSWEDVERARQNETSAAAEVTRVEGLIESLNNTVAETQSAANIAANEFQTADANATQAEIESNRLASELETATAAAETSAGQVAVLMAKMGRGTGSSTSLELLADPGAADDALYKLGAMTKLTTRSTEVLEKAKQDANLVTSLNDQAEVATGILQQARDDASASLQRATDTANAAQAAVAEQEANQGRLIEQLASLKGTRVEEEQQYAVGVAVRAEEARKRAEEEARRQAEARAAAAAAAAAAEANKPRPGTGGGGGGGGAVTPPPPQTGNGTGTYFAPSSSGWWRPAPGGITSWYGPRPVMCPNGCSVPFHAGLDFGGASGTQIKAVQAGTVIFVGNAGGFGNRVIVDHGGGVHSVYGHLSGYNTRVGAQVAGGQVIAYMGMTGVATGPHLDLKIEINGRHTDPAAFLRARGVRI
ncbi:M23 family metallopeptidase [Mycetocola spongiae]|uniref:M23 family metallopeptidase n=1 Tax=Mycetocola spongiae TaxID=2859226 RepID=UPI001CF5D5D2|nr:M23 family metallopeptidase [Mycetocola spongiae]UCR88339.1 M23 family metallopeptidase [Mycetocola spongiae]